MYCLNCQYRLHGLPENTCPECGTTFNPDDPSTFNPEPITQVVNPLHFTLLVLLSYLVSFVLGRIMVGWPSLHTFEALVVGQFFRTCSALSVYILPGILIPYLIICARKARTRRGIGKYIKILAMLMLLAPCAMLLADQIY